MGYVGKDHAPFAASRPERPPTPPRHVAGAVRDLAAAIGRGDDHAIETAKRELGRFGWRLVSARELKQEQEQEQAS